MQPYKPHHHINLHYFCDIISFKYGLDFIPANFVYEEIRRVRKIYAANNDKDNIKCKSLKRKRK